MLAGELTVAVVFCLVCAGEGNFLDRYFFDRDDGVKRSITNLGRIMNEVDPNTPRRNQCFRDLAFQLKSENQDKNVHTALFKIESKNCTNDNRVKEWWFTFNKTQSLDLYFDDGRTITPLQWTEGNGHCATAVVRTRRCHGNTIRLPIEGILLEL